MATAALAGCRARPAPGLPPEIVADYVFSVIAADRATYAEDVVNRLQNVDGVFKAAEHFREDKALPLPAQMLRMGAQRAAQHSRMRYALISTWAINKTNLPKTDFEKQGLARVVAHPDEPYRSYETVEGRPYFMAMYADRAVSAACIQCHNHHSESPRHDFKQGDVIGGITISFPVDAAP
jgi:hypothetical protein